MLDGRHPEAGELAMRRLEEVLRPDGALFVEHEGSMREMRFGSKRPPSSYG